VAGVVAACTGAWWDPAISAVFDGIGEWIVTSVGEAMSAAAEQFMSLAFNNPLTEISEGEWQIAVRQASRWGAVFTVVAVAVCAVEVVAALIARDTSRVLRAGIIAAVAWPMTVAAILILAELVAVTDGLSGQMFDNVAGTGAVGSAAAATAMGAAVGALTAVTVGGGWIVILIGALVCIVGLVMLAMVMSARAFGLLVATGFAPVALMLVGFRGTRGMARKWVEVVAGLLLTKPLAAGIIVLCLELAGEGSLDSFIMGTVGVWVAVFSPALALSLVSFAGAHLSAAVTAHADSAKGIARQASQAGATRLALEGPNAEALSKLGTDAARVAKGMGGALGSLGDKLTGRDRSVGTQDGQSDTDTAPEDSTTAAPDTSPTPADGTNDDSSHGDGADGDLPADSSAGDTPTGQDGPGEAGARDDVDAPTGKEATDASEISDPGPGQNDPEGALAGGPDGGGPGLEPPDDAGGAGEHGGTPTAPGMPDAGSAGVGHGAPGAHGASTDPGAPGASGGSGADAGDTSAGAPAPTDAAAPTPAAPGRTGSGRPVHGESEGGAAPGHGGAEPSVPAEPGPAPGPARGPAAPRQSPSGGGGGRGPNPFGGR
jgi:hypothetical protein